METLLQIEERSPAPLNDLRRAASSSARMPARANGHANSFSYSYNNITHHHNNNSHDDDNSHEDYDAYGSDAYGGDGEAYDGGDDDEQWGASVSSLAREGSGLSTPPARAAPRPTSEEVLARNLVGLLNRRGYNVRESLLAESSETSTSSIASTGSSISSVLLGLREPVHGQGPLHLAVRKGDCHVLDAVLESGLADDVLDARDNNGNTALHFAAAAWRRPQGAPMVARLLRAGADVAARNKRGLTPVGVHMLTLKADDPAVLLLLLERGADAETEVDGASLLHVAARRDLGVIAGVLVAFGASLAALNADGLMCYEAASKRVRRFMVRSLHRAPPFVAPAQRSRCMRCSNALLSPAKLVANALKRALGLRVARHQSNCYLCGLVFCGQCLKRTQAPDALPFARSPDDKRARAKTCRLCEATLHERQLKKLAQHAFDAHLMGFGSAAL